MHIDYDIYYFIDSFNFKELSNINKNINIIYRNYSAKDYLNDLIKTKNFCKKKGFKLFISNNLRLSIKLNLDGLYLPSFNKKLRYNNILLRNKFKIIGSAHNIIEAKIKEKQNCSEIFISPIFKTNKYPKYLNTVKFNLLSNNISKSIVGLGGINSNNLKKVNLTKCTGVAAISWIKKNGLNKI